MLLLLIGKKYPHTWELQRKLCIGKGSLFVGNSITKPIEKISPLSTPFVNPYNNSMSFVYVYVGENKILDCENLVRWCVKKTWKFPFCC